MNLPRALLHAWLLVVCACTKQQGQEATDVTVTVADSVCRLEENQPSEPEWVAIACAVEGIAGGIVHIIMPREQGLAMLRATRGDAGVGK